MKFSIAKTQIQKAETLYAYVAVVMCVAIFAVYCITSLGGGAVTVSGELGELYRKWIKETALYEIFGFSELEEIPPPDSVYTARCDMGQELL